MSNELTKTTEQKPDTLKSLVEKPVYMNRFRQVLGERAPQFVSSLIQVGASPSLRNCEPNSVIAAAMTAAALDLPIDRNLGMAHIVPYKDKASFQMGYKGFVQLGLRSGQYRHLNVAEVHEGELIRHDRVKGETIIDETKRTSEKVIGYVAYLQLMNGFEHSEYWSAEDVREHAERYSRRSDSPWSSNFDAMARKTVLKDLISHWGPMSVQMIKAVTEDQGVRSSVDGEISYPDNEDESRFKMAKPAKVEVEAPVPSPEDDGREPSATSKAA